MDAIDLLFSAHARTVKTFLKKGQAIAKLKVSQVIMEQELQNLEEQSSAQQNQRNLFRPINTTSSTSSFGRSQSNSPYCENTLLDSLRGNQTFVMLIQIWNSYNQQTLTTPLLLIISHNSIRKTSNN